MTPVPRRIWLMTALYALAYSVAGGVRYRTYHSGADLGLFAQTISSTLHGFTNTVEGGSHFAFHFSPLLFLLAPVLWIVRSPFALIAVQAFAAALTVPALYLIARRRMTQGTAIAVAAVAFVYPPLAGVTFSDFHENGFVPAATLWLLWAVDARRWRAAAAFVAILLATKEDQAVILFCAGAAAVVFFARRGDRAGMRFAAGTVAASVAVFVLFFAIVRPLAAGGHMWEPLHFYAHDAPERVVRHPFVERCTYLLEAFVPLCFVCFASPLVLLALPGFAELFFSRDPVTYTMGQHYAAVWIGYVLAAFAFGVARIAREHPQRALRIVQASLAICVLNLAFASPTHWGHYLSWPTAHDVTLDRFIEELPPGITVGTHDEIYAHIGMNPNASLGLSRVPPYALFDSSFATSYWVEKTSDALRGPGSRYSVDRANDGIVLYRRIAEPGEVTPVQGAEGRTHARR